MTNIFKPLIDNSSSSLPLLIKFFFSLMEVGIVQLGLSSYGASWAVGVPGYPAPAQPLTAQQLVEKAHALGLRLVQIIDNLPLHPLTDAEHQAVRATAARLGVGIEVGTRGILPDHLRRYIALARDYNSPILRVVIASDDHHPTPSEIIGIVRDALPELEAAGITLAIENHDRFKARDLAAIIDTLDTPLVGICLDTVNSFGAMEGTEMVVETLGRYVVNLHIKDFTIRRADHNLGFILTGAPAGSGMLDVPWLLDALARHGRQFNAIIENWVPPQADSAATVALENEWIEQGVKYLRTLIRD
jgi:3-oxoisoapionate decarboxylase